MVLENTTIGVSKWKPLWAVCISHLIRKIDAKLIFVLKHHLKSAF